MLDSTKVHDLSQTFLQNPATKEQVAHLRELIRLADKSYYVQHESILADEVYDVLFQQLKDLEAKHPEIIVSNSPTQRVANGIVERQQTIAHAVPMLSLDNTYNADDLLAWAKRCEQALPSQQLSFCVEPKYDGASISLTYTNGSLTQALTRGDGLQGEEVTHNVRQIKSLPLQSQKLATETTQLEVRGEVLFHKTVFANINQQRQEEGLPLLANPRNAASGTLRILDPTEARKRPLDIQLYHVAEVNFHQHTNAFHTHEESIAWLHQAGLPTPQSSLKVFQKIEEVVDYCMQFEAERDTMPYEVDGLVIKVNDLAMQEQLGMTAHHPRWAVAYKFKARQATSKLLQIDYQVGRTGSVTPVAKIEPVAIGGVTITSVSLFNADIIREKDLKIGDTILVERAGDVIPYIVMPLINLRTGTEQEILFPTHCPVCESVLEKPAEEAVWRCVNINCEAQIVERIAHFCSKDAMDIRGLGDSLVKKFFDLGILHSIVDIYTLAFDRLQNLEGFGEKSISNLKEAIEKSKQQPLHRLIFGLGIRHVGETTSKTLAREVHHLSDLYGYSTERLSALEDIGPKVAASVHQFFQHEENRALLSNLENAGVNLTNNQKQQLSADGAFTGKSFLFTGTLAQLKRNDAEALAEEKGGKILSGVSTKLDFLVVGADAGSKLEKAKKLGTVHIITEAEFIEMMKETR